MPWLPWVWATLGVSQKSPPHAQVCIVAAQCDVSAGQRSVVPVISLVAWRFVMQAKAPQNTLQPSTSNPTQRLTFSQPRRHGLVKQLCQEKLGHEPLPLHHPKGRST